MGRGWACRSRAVLRRHLLAVGLLVVLLVALPAVLWIALLVALLAVVPLALHEHKSDSAAAAGLADSSLCSWELFYYYPYSTRPLSSILRRREVG